MSVGKARTETTLDQPEAQSRLQQAIKEAEPLLLRHFVDFFLLMLNVLKLTGLNNVASTEERLVLIQTIQSEKAKLMFKLFGESPTNMDQAVFDSVIRDYVEGWNLHPTAVDEALYGDLR
jgi:hypothetical protein